MKFLQGLKTKKAWDVFMDNSSQTVEAPLELLTDAFSAISGGESGERAAYATILVATDMALQYLCGIENLGSEKLYKRMFFPVAALPHLCGWTTTMEERRPIYLFASPEGIEAISNEHPGASPEEVNSHLSLLTGRHLVELSGGEDYSRAEEAFALYWWYRDFVYLSVHRLRNGLPIPTPQPFTNLMGESAQMAFDSAMNESGSISWYPGI
jgi:hypothetical protein